MSLAVSPGNAQRNWALAGMVGGLLLASGCVRRLPPAAPPEPVFAGIDANAPLEQGKGRLVVDVVDGPTPIERIRMNAESVETASGRQRVALFEGSEPLCSTTPCVLDLPVGNVALGFPVAGDPARREIELVHVGPETSVYRRVLSQYDGRTGGTRVLGIIGTAVGATALTTGAALLPIGLSNGNDGLTIAGGASLGVGAALLALGIWAIHADSPTYRPGSSLHFSPTSP